MRKHHSLVTALAVSVFLSSCTAGSNNTAPPSPALSSETTSPAPTAGSGQGEVHDHGADENYGVPEMTWDPQSEAAVRDVAGKAMGLFARPDVPEEKWFADLAPYLSAEYAADAKYIDPARVPVRKVMTGPALGRDAGNPATVTANFSTDAGRWRMILHRAGQDKPWLVTGIAPEDPA